MATDYFLSHVLGQPILPRGHGQPIGIVMKTCHHAISKHEQLTSIYTQFANRVLRHPIAPCPNIMVPRNRLPMPFCPTCSGAYTISDDAKATEHIHQWINQTVVEIMRSNKKHKHTDDTSRICAKTSSEEK